MILSPISVIDVSDIISILNAYEGFSEKSEVEKLEFIGLIQQDICNLNNDAGKSDYLLNNYTDPLSPAVGPAYGIRAGSGTASIAGTPITFELGSIPSPLTKIPEIQLSLGVSYIDPDMIDLSAADTRTIYGFTAFASEDGIPFSYIAMEST